MKSATRRVPQLGTERVQTGTRVRRFFPIFGPNLEFLQFLHPLLPGLAIVLATLTVGCNQVRDFQSARDILSPQERAWLTANRDRITLAIETGYAPFVFIDGKNRPQGLAHEFMLLIESRLGVVFRERQFPSLAGILESAKRGEVDIVNAVTQTPQRSAFLAFTDSYVTVPNVIIVRKEGAAPMREEDLASMRVALVKSYAVTDYLLSKNSGLIPRLSADDATALLEVSFGRADAAVIDLATASFLIEQKGITNLCVAGEADFDIRLSIGVPIGETVLRDILQKGLNTITNAERDLIHERWFPVSPHSLLADRRLWMTTGAALLALLGFLVWNRSLTRQVALRTRALLNEKEAVRKNAEEHRAILAAAMDGVWRMDVAGRILEVNDTYCRMSGYTAAELLGMEMARLEPVENADALAARLRGIRRAGEGRFESQHRRKDGSLYDVEVSVQYRDFDDGRFIVFLRDISERKQAESLERKHKERMQAMLQAVPDLIFRLDAQGCFLDYRAELSDLHLQTESIIGKRNRDIAPPDFAELIDCKIRVTLETQQIQTFEYQLNVPGRGDRDYEARMVPSGPAEVIAIVRDVTDSKRLEEKLRQSQKMEAIGQLAGGVAHDFNNILQIIVANLGIVLEDRLLSESNREAIEVADSAAQRAADLTRQLLAFGRRQLMSPVYVDLNELAEHALKMLRRIIGEHIRLSFVPGKESATVFADRGQIEQVLMNLCVNARDAMPRGGTLSISIASACLDAAFCRTHPWAAEGRFVCLRVADTGQGMDPATAARIFEPFFTTKGLGKGTGLGLSTVYGIVTHHKGLVHVESAPGQGTLLEVYLPAADPPPPEEPRPKDRSTGGHETILIAEDEPIVLKSEVLLLERAGYTVLGARDGQEAIKLWEQHKDTIDLAVLDVLMPGLGGRQVMERIQTETPRIRFLFCSGYGESAIHADFAIDTTLCLIQKPFDGETLLDAVRQVLDTGTLR